jgi:glycosyltransferase involved in cell wall biosynthesis
MAQVSVVVPIYNVESYLQRSLDSLMKQTYHDFEVLCINDGSTDASAKIIQQFVDCDTRFKRHDKENGGLSDARNYGLKRVTSKFVMFLDSDDFYELDMLEKAMTRMVQDQLDCVIFDYNQYFDETNLKEQIHLPFDATQTYDPRVHKSLFAYVNNAAWNKVYRTDLFKVNNIEYPFGYRHQDLGTTFRYLTFCERVGFIHEPLYNYLADRPNNITQQVDTKIDHILDMVQLNLDFFKSKHIFDVYYEELKYLSVINLMYSFRKLTQFTDRRFVFEFIDRTFDLIKSNFPDYPKSKYPIQNVPNARIYLSRRNLKAYYVYASIRRVLCKKS